MSTQSTPHPPGDAPLTRRQRRERERSRTSVPAHQQPQERLTRTGPGAPGRTASSAPAEDTWSATPTSFDRVVTGTASAGGSSPDVPAAGRRRVSGSGRVRALRTRHGPDPGFGPVPSEPRQEPFHAAWAERAYTRSSQWGTGRETDRGAEAVKGAWGTGHTRGTGEDGEETSASSAGSPAEPEEPAGPSPSAEPPLVTGPQKVLGAALGRRPRGLVALTLVGLVVIAMVLIPLAVANLGGRGSLSSAGAAETVLPGDAELGTVVEVAGRQGTVPVVSVKGVLSAPASLVTDVLVEGTGRKVVEDGPVMLSVSTFSGISGANTTGTDSGTYLYVGLLNDHVGQDMDSVLQGRTEGSRVVLRAPAQEEGTRTTEITVVDILPTTAAGEEQPPAAGMPAVTEEKDGSVSVSVGGVPAPSRAAISTLVQGSGPQVGAEDRVVARYTIVSWSTGKEVTESTYGDSVVPRVINMTNTYAGISQLLTDVAVGSRVVLALTPELARGEDAVVVVVDVLAIRDGSAAEDDSVTETGPTGTAGASTAAEAG